MRRLLLASTVTLAAAFVLLPAGCTNEPTDLPTTHSLLTVIVSGDNQTGTVGTQLTNPLIVRAVDAHGHPSRHLDVHWVVTSGGGHPAVDVNQTDQNGNAFNYWTLGTAAADSQRLEARVASTNELLGAFTARAFAGPATTIARAAGDSQTAVRGATVPVAPAVRVTDQYGNPVIVYTITFAVTGGGGSVTGATPATDGSGIARLGGWTLGPTPGVNTLTATATGLAGNPVLFTATGTTGPVSASRSTVIALPTGIIANAVDSPSVITVTAKDDGGFPIRGATVTLAATGAGNTLTQPAAVTDSNGATSGTLRSTVVGSKVVSATISGTAVTQTATVAVITGPPASIIITAGDSQTAYTGHVVAVLPTVRVRDAAGNPVPGVQVTFADGIGAGSIFSPDPTPTDDSGRARVTWGVGPVPGPYTLIAKAAGLGADSVIFTETGVSPAKTIELVAGENQGATVDSAVAIIPDFQALDSTGNPVSVLLEFDVLAGTGRLSGNSVDSTGRHATGTITGWRMGPVAGMNTLRARVVGTGISATVSAAGVNAFWTSQASLPVERFGLGAAVVNDVIYAVGGNGFSLAGGEAFGTVEAYDPATDQWTMRSPMPTPRGDLAVGVVNGILYAVGGGDGQHVFDAVEAYDPATDTWTSKAPLPTPRSDLSVAVVNGILYAIGGAVCSPPGSGAGCYQSVNTVEAYDPATDTWTTKAPMPTSRWGLGTAVLNGTIYAVGGQITGGAVTLPAVEAYDPSSDIWATRAPLLTPRFTLGVSAINGLIYASGGMAPLGNSFADTRATEVYDPASDTWSASAGAPTSRELFAFVTALGRIYAIGGNGAFNVVEAFHP